MRYSFQLVFDMKRLTNLEKGVSFEVASDARAIVGLAIEGH